MDALIVIFIFWVPSLVFASIMANRYEHGGGWMLLGAVLCGPVGAIATWGIVAAINQGMEREWWYLHVKVGGTYKRGPVKETHMINWVCNNQISKDTHVWSRGMSQWERIKDVSKLCIDPNAKPVIPKEKPIKDKIVGLVPTKTQVSQWSGNAQEVYVAPPVVKVRCRSCKGLQEETALYCSMCGTPL